ncbi:MAG: hypothetical protein M0Z75_14715, partial [Nitrospiraceae bacterium]|nr:hypothetical protein [Nitrospiraceae bacterium]
GDGEELSAGELEILRDEAEERDEGPASKEERLSLKIGKLTVGEKIRVSLRAGKEVRGLLMKDSNKQVVLGVIANPKITVSEVEMAARMRSIPEEALRQISRNREWVKNYDVVHNLVVNPKTPAGVAVGLLPRMRAKDLAFIQKNKEIPDAVRTAAKKLTAARNKNR